MIIHKQTLRLLAIGCLLVLTLSSCGSFGKQVLNSFVENFTGRGNATTSTTNTTGMAGDATDYRRSLSTKATLKGTVSLGDGEYDIYSDHHAELKKVYLYAYKFINFEIPDEINYDYETYKVTVVGANACKGNYPPYSLGSLVIGKNVIEIGDNAFSGNERLCRVTFNNNLEIIGENAFSGCPSLTDVTLEGALRFIGNRAFSSYTNNIGLDITRAYKLEYVGDEAFFRGNNKYKNNLVLPNSIRHIGDKAFYNYQSDNIPEKVESIGEEGLPLKSKSWVLPVGIKYLGKNAFGDKWSNNYTELIIPDGTLLREFDVSYFPSCTTIKLGGGIKKVKGTIDFLKERSELKTIKFPSTLEEIEDNCFDGIESLSSVIGMEDCDVLKRIGKRAFYGSNLSMVSIPESVSEIGEQAFENSKKLKSVEFNGCPKIIRKGAFAYCPQLIQPAIPEGTTLEKGVFFNP